MKKGKDKYAPAVIQELCGIFAKKDSNESGYLSGPKLISLFNSLGFADAYQFPGGIQTPDDSGISRTAYAFKRLTELNDTYQIPEAISKLIEVSSTAQKTVEEINAVFSRYKILFHFHISMRPYYQHKQRRKMLLKDHRVAFH